MLRHQLYLFRHQKNVFKKGATINSRLRKRFLSTSIILILIMISVFISACGGMGRVSSLRAIDFISDDVIEIPLPFKYGYRPGNSTEVLCQCSVDEMAEKIRTLSSEKAEYTVSEYPGGKLLIEIEGAEGKKAVAMLSEIYSQSTTEEYPYFYVFFSPVAGFSGAELIFPFHLVNDERLNTYHDLIEPGLKYRTDYGRDEFIDFYLKISDYYPQLDPDRIEVINQCLIIKSNYVKGKNEILEIEFHCQDGDKYFSIQFMDNINAIDRGSF